MNPQIIQDEQPRLKNIYLFVGRSGSGKTTITDALWHGSRKIVTIGIGVSRENLARRMSARGESSVNIEARMRNDDEMFQRMNECCDVIFDNNGDLEQTIAEIADFIEKKEEYT